ncbi:MAG: tRNA (adenosine(37)-N6)-threonylcarbamoyltransferase complex transferase subunit TsaD [Flavobacteriales bacterium]|nr:tRNA (adenosine(37)-N6)-threonylcarbamoyltransferase complex transferase subunit TsaD [Flavobacteriales bacterium]
MKRPIKILAIESSCDDTSAAVLYNRRVVANLIANQSVHANYGGVVPELASREHQKNIIPVVDACMKKANCELHDIDAVAFTQGPGLLGSLLVGANFAKGLSLALNKPLIAVNHMKAHILAHFIENNEYATPPAFPLLCLTVSGGHTQIVLVKGPFDMQIIGQTLDDAAGEAYDKIAKQLGLPYPGGPQIDKLAQQGMAKFEFSKSSIGNFDFSFSGLKTSVLYFLQKEMKKNDQFINENLADLCASVQLNIVDTLIQKLHSAAKELNIDRLALAGGVSANSYLRLRLTQLGEQEGLSTFIPRFEYCTDNAAMIGIVGYYAFLEKKFESIEVVPSARLPF